MIAELPAFNVAPFPHTVLYPLILIRSQAIFFTLIVDKENQTKSLEMIDLKCETWEDLSPLSLSQLTKPEHDLVSDYSPYQCIQVCYGKKPSNWCYFTAVGSGKFSEPWSNLENIPSHDIVKNWVVLLSSEKKSMPQ